MSSKEKFRNCYIGLHFFFYEGHQSLASQKYLHSRMYALEGKTGYVLSTALSLMARLEFGIS